MSLCNSKLQDKRNRLNMSAKDTPTSKPNAKPINLPITVHPKMVTDTCSRQPANQLTTILVFLHPLNQNSLLVLEKILLPSCHQYRCGSMLISLSQDLIHVLRL